MIEIKWDRPATIGNPAFMGMALAMAAQKTIMEANMKKYFPIQYRMMKTMQADMEKNQNDNFMRRQKRF